jgi:2,4-dienoyl-CoA reductase-like NADH-dependent reductase (Old Yellow Enzyme family)
MILKEYAFEEAFFLPKARQFRAALALPLMLLGGVTKLETMDRAVEEGFDFVAIGRALICEPDLVQRMQAGLATTSLCTPCNRCIVEMDKGGTRCVEREVEAARLNS